MLRPGGQSQLCFPLVLTHCCTCLAMLEHQLKQAGGLEVTCSRKSMNGVFVNGQQKAGHPEQSLHRSTCQLRPQMQKLISTKWFNGYQFSRYVISIQLCKSMSLQAMVNGSRASSTRGAGSALKLPLCLRCKHYKVSWKLNWKPSELETKQQGWLTTHWLSCGNDLVNGADTWPNAFGPYSDCLNSM